ncbi:MAG: hypothetical protein LRS48_01220 [Desulfurococcales archaeon]|nr:hypothetical protein [Desulfurococcales archaeon]
MPGPGYDPRRTNRGYRPRPGGGRPHYRQPKPRPIGDKCNPLCPFFRCSRNALRITTEQFKGRIIRVPFCSWIGDKCIGAQCRFAYCEKKAMLPDGRCAFAVGKKREEKDFEEDLREIEEEEKKYRFKDYF